MHAKVKIRSRLKSIEETTDMRLKPEESNTWVSLT